MLWFLKGLIIGFSVAVPVGPIGLLCIRRTLKYGRWAGLATGLGAAVADTTYGLIALWGLNWIADLFINNQFWLQPLGGLVLIYLGIRIFRSTPLHNDILLKDRSVLSDFSTTFFLTLTNPLTILSFTALFAAIGLGDRHMLYLSNFTCALGVFLGSLMWWSLLCESLMLFRHRFSDYFLVKINKIAGALIIVFGIAALCVTI